MQPLTRAKDMKKPTNLFNFGFITVGWIVFILLCYTTFKDEKANVLKKMKDSLQETTNIDYQERLNKILISYRPLGRKIKGIQIKCADSIETIYFEDSTHESLAIQLANQYVMAQTNSVKPDHFNKIFRKEWEKNGIFAAKTGIIYCHNKKKVFSDNDSISFQSALVTPVQMIDARQTASVQAWAMIHWTEIVKHTVPKVLWSIIAYFIVLLWVSLSFLKKPLKKDIPESHLPKQFGKMTLKLESKKLYINDQPCPIAPTDFKLLALFINAPEHFLTKEDIKNVLWPKEDKPDNKIHCHISTLKSSIKNFPKYQIITEPGKGYRLILSQTNE